MRGIEAWRLGHGGFVLGGHGGGMVMAVGKILIPDHEVTGGRDGARQPLPLMSESHSLTTEATSRGTPGWVPTEMRRDSPVTPLLVELTSSPHGDT
jgi:hypothetical protein